MSFNYEELARQLGIQGRRSGEQLVGRCPIHQDSKPSFSLNLMHGKWTCFSNCGSGNFEHLIMKIQGGTLTEAKDWMIQSAALVPVRNPNIEYPIRQDVDLAWLHQWARSDRTVLPQWWFDRNLTWETANKCDIRYDQETQQLLIPFFVGDKLEGIIRRNFIGGPKYQNSPGLPRSKFLYGLQPQTKSGLILWLCEGATDQIWLQQCGYFPVAALLGLNMSEEHIRLMHGFDEICISMDNDFMDKVNHGQEAADKIEKQLLNAGRTLDQITRLRLPEGRKDVGDCTELELAQAFEERKQ